jgi:arylsulfatase A-like enzyme/tetratricopeptide (TPR) repeat protein
MIRTLSLAAFATALALTSALPRAQQGTAARPNVLLVTLDTFRADRIGAYGYTLASTPHLDRLAREGVRFADATTQAPLTAPAHAALLTGQYPTRLGVKDNASTPLPESAQTLAETLKGSGYRTGAFIGAFVLDRPYGFAQGFDHFDAAFQGFRPELKQQAQRIAADVAAPAIAWITSAPAGAPFFAWVHFYDAHLPYSAPAPVGAKFAKRPYDGEVSYVDAAVGRLLAALAGSGALDRTIVVAVADHGEALGEHGEEDHGMFLYEGVLRIPWLMRLPNAERAGTVVAEQVRAIDVVPTVLDLTGVGSKGRLDGESVAGVLRGSARRDPPPSYADAHFPQLHFGWSMLRSLRVGEWKFIDAPKPELYDLRTDRAEARSVLAERSSVAARMGGELETLWRGFGSAADTAPPQPDPETLARLRSLGYVGIAAPSSRTGRGADPKDKIEEMKLFRGLLSRAIDDLSAGRHDAAIERLTRAAGINERAYDVHLLLGDAWRQKGTPERALGEYDAAALLNPVIAAPHVLAAEVHIAQGAFDKAMARLETAAKLEPGSAEVASARGRVHERAGRGADALAEYQRAVSLNPSDMPARARLANAAMMLRRFDLAEPQLRILLTNKHQPARTHFALGVVAESRGDLPTAATEYRRALALEPGLAQAKQALARITKNR